MIKTFENFKKHEKYYWLISTDDRYYSSLNKIGVSNEIINSFFKSVLNYIKSDYYRSNYIYVGYDSADINYTDGWSYNFLDNVKDSNRFDKHSWYEGYEFKFMGKVDIPDYELDSIKYNI